MHSKILIIIFLIASIGSISCKKDPKPEYIFVEDNNKEHLSFNFHNDTLRSYKLYLNDNLDKIITFQYFDDVIKQTTSYPGSSMQDIHSFYINSSGYALNSIDSIKNSYGYLLIYTSYTYNEGGYLIEKTEKQVQSENTDTTTTIFQYDYSGGNITSITNANNGCMDTYTYDSKANEFDILFLSANLTGRINNNLVKRIDFKENCPCGNETEGPYLVNTFKTNTDGYVTEKTETYTPCHKINEDIEVEKTIHKSTYEYNFTYPTDTIN